MSTPVAIFVFNRPDYTRRVLTKIADYRPTTLFVIADGPRDVPGDAELCKQTRSIFDRIDWECDVRRSYSPVNLGCGLRVSSGLDWVFSETEEAIVLEDDCVPHASFFGYCERLLDRYRDNARVMMVGGTNYLLNRLSVQSSYIFSRYFAVWGWASWRRAWDHYDFSMNDWPLFRESGDLSEVFTQEFMRSHITQLFDDVWSRKIDTWDVQWFFAGLKARGLSAVPRANLISNVGLVGTHTGGRAANRNLPVFDINGGELIHPPRVAPEDLYDEVFFREQFYRTPVQHVEQRLKRFVFPAVKALRRLRG